MPKISQIDEVPCQAEVRILQKITLKVYESNNFSDCSFYHIFESEKFRTPFSTKNSLTWGVKFKKIKLKKIVGNLLDMYQLKNWKNGRF